MKRFSQVSRRTTYFGTDEYIRMTMTPGLVRVLLSTYNGAQFVRPLLDSVLAQTHNPLELWVRDDGSHDETPEILSEYARRFPESMRVDLGTNLGAVPSYFTLLRNAGVGAEFTALCGHDDVWHPDKIERGGNLALTRRIWPIAVHGPAAYRRPRRPSRR
jgi:glycosyltransferase involved in cell wall biosynthesis